VIQREQIRPQDVNRVTLTVGRPLPATPTNRHRPTGSTGQFCTNRVVLIFCKPLLVYPEQRTLTDPPRWPGSCQLRTIGPRATVAAD